MRFMDRPCSNAYAAHESLPFQAAPGRLPDRRVVGASRRHNDGDCAGHVSPRSTRAILERMGVSPKLPVVVLVSALTAVGVAAAACSSFDASDPQAPAADGAADNAAPDVTDAA